MKKSDIRIDPGYYTRYIDLVPDTDLITALEASLQALQALDIAQLEPLADYAYAPGKWTLKNVLQHITDTERVFTYRAMMFARKDPQTAPSMDQDVYADNAEVDDRSLADVLTELTALRTATLAQFRGYSDTALSRTGMSWKTVMSVLALGFTIVGHQVHHLDIMRKRYLQDPPEYAPAHN
jgi:DinB superfamily